MILTGPKIYDEVQAGRIEIKPFDERMVNPNSYNVRLADEILVYSSAILDTETENKTRRLEPVFSRGKQVYFLVPGELYLARTLEYTRTDHYVPVLNGRSSIGRLGISIHVTAGFGDVGFRGRWTLEITVVKPIYIQTGIQIGQISFHEISGEPVLYAGKYQDSLGVIESLLHLDSL